MQIKNKQSLAKKYTGPEKPFVVISPNLTYAIDPDCINGFMKHRLEQHIKDLELKQSVSLKVIQLMEEKIEYLEARDADDLIDNWKTKYEAAVEQIKELENQKKELENKIQKNVPSFSNN
ncbi:MAG TPA: hypothetical protein VGP43_02430 [Chitinophagaceae bacterium]|nr:hypothetical protein [Chitinophagaceae bacterium]